MGVWAEPFTTLRMLKIFNLMHDPYERADITSNTYWDWHLNHIGNVYGLMDVSSSSWRRSRNSRRGRTRRVFNPANILEEIEARHQGRR